MKRYTLQINLSNFPSISCSIEYYPKFEFHILGSARKKYEVEESLFTTSGNIIFPNYNAVRILAQKMNAQYDLQKHPEQAIRIGQLNAMGLVDEIYHYVLRRYEETENLKCFQGAEKKLKQILKPKEISETLHQFGTLFPPLDVYLGRETLENYLMSHTGSKPHTEITLEEMILLYFANFNPAFIPFKELFDDKELNEGTVYANVIVELEKFFQTEQRFGPQNQFIFDLLRAPIQASPYSLEGQLQYIKKHWGMILSEKFHKKIFGAGDLIKEDTKLIFHGEPAAPPVPTYSIENMKGVGLFDYEQFTSDLDWMPKVTMFAKNTYVWLYQLSKKYNRSITKLNEIPDEELDEISRWNITALWLIGIWERSSASQKIKQWTGNPEAAASAYSVYDYEIANDLGGEEAFQNLRNRAWQRGIRLAGDMVPNHMGIYSKWVLEHTEYFIQSEYPPFPNYRFSGENLSDDPDVELRIEDGYWNRNDAAVVFQRIDRRSGNVRYIYHGNDGTHMPWNDTAQLDFLKNEVREAVIQNIFQVAQKFSIIRFDAAMTLTKRHFQRLWYPQPGSGGDIPSRSDHTLTTEEFNKFFPNEFWREVVDRINNEMPNTLLLAEAFWLLEGYFVRSLGMHRVYNSAFMHMLMKEENSKYRELIKNTLHYNPEILKRYVNFMSNPDEQTAIAQFGKDDKYFGVALMMATLPGLPMFAHGQIEGYTEKYGMEYKRAYSNEEPDRDLIQRHEREIFPLLGKRFLFSQVINFELYDFIDKNSKLNENIFAYSNKADNERTLICYNNKYEETEGWIKTSVGRNVGTTDEPKIIYKTLGEALELDRSEKIYYLFKDYRTGLEYIRSGKILYERGLHIILKAFQYQIFLDFKEVYDSTGEYERLVYHLHGNGVFDIQEEFWMVKLSPIYLKFYELINVKTIGTFRNICYPNNRQQSGIEMVFNSILSEYQQLIKQVKSILGGSWEISIVEEEFLNQLQSIQELSSDDWHINNEKHPIVDLDSQHNTLVLYCWLLIHNIEKVEKPGIFGKLRLEKAFPEIFKSFSQNEEVIKELINLISLLLSENVFLDNGSNSICIYLNRSDVQEFIRLNEYEGVKYYNKECFEQLIRWHFLIALVQMYSVDDGKRKSAWMNQMYPMFKKILTLSIKVKYQFEGFKTQLSQIN